MTEREPLDDWQLRDADDSGDQWQLLDTEQTLPDELTLQQGESEATEWQPVEYEPEQTKGRSWFLPLFIVVALVAVIAYVLWLGLNNFGMSPLGLVDTAEPAPETVSEPAVVAVEPSPTPMQEEPTATPLPTVVATPTAVPSPTPSLVEQLVGTIQSQYGVNARSQPSTDSEALEILEDGGQFAVTDQTEDGWTQLRLADGRSVWVSSDFVNVVTELVPAEEAVAPVQEAAPVAEEAAPETDAPPSAGGLLTGQVSTAAGTNLREGPDTDSVILQLLDDGAAVTVDGRSADGEWLSVTVADGTRGWVFGQLVTLAGDAGELPVVGEGAPEAEVGPVTSGVVPPAPFTNTVAAGQAAVIIEEALGVNARTSASSEGDIVLTIPEGAAVTATGRSDSGEWIRIALPNDVVAWVAAAAVAVTDAVADLPTVGTIEVAESAPLTATTTLTATVSPTVTEVLSPVVIVGNLVGVNARVAPANEAELATRIPGGGTTLPAVGRSEDGDWIQVQLEDETLAWVYAAAIELNVEPQDLPLVE